MKTNKDLRIYQKNFGKYKRVIKTTEILSNSDLDEIFVTDSFINSANINEFKKSKEEKINLLNAKTAYKKSKSSDIDFKQNQMELAALIATSKCNLNISKLDFFLN